MHVCKFTTKWFELTIHKDVSDAKVSLHVDLFHPEDNLLQGFSSGTVQILTGDESDVPGHGEHEANAVDPHDIACECHVAIPVHDFNWNVVS